MSQKERFQVHHELRQSIKSLSLRGLRKSANWCAELLQNFSQDPQESPPTPIIEENEATSDIFLVAKCYFDLQEYDRCAWSLLTGGTTPPNPQQYPLDYFLWANATYLGGERRKEEGIREGTLNATNENLQILIESLQQATTDPFCSWLLGVCLKERGGAMHEAKLAFVQSVILFPYNWSAWLDLFQLCSNLPSFFEILKNVPDSWPKRLFHVYGLLELQNSKDVEELGLVEKNLEMFPKSPFAIAQKAMMYYGLTDYETAHGWFDELSRMDPYRLQNVDSFSNLLFVKEAKAELSHLAHQVFRVDRYRAESCCVVGNYYALKRHHERAVTYFKRALRQNRNFHSALILLGHEFTELKNLPAALETYRQAVDLSPSDYRGWYGLGHSYELSRMFYYSLHYYHKAKSLRPYDPRMWCALGGSYENINMFQNAIKCYERAEDNGDKEGIAVIKLAKLFEKSNDRKNAAKYYKKHLEKRKREGLVLLKINFTESKNGGGDNVDSLAAPPSLPKQEDQDALKFLVIYFRDEYQLDEALVYAENLQRIAGAADREAESLLIEIQNKKTSETSRRRSNLGRS